jgi:hypothetical protein
MIEISFFGLAILVFCGIIFGALGFKFLYERELNTMTAALVALDSFCDNIKELSESDKTASYIPILKEIQQNLDEVFSLISEYKVSEYARDMFSIFDRKSHRPAVRYDLSKIKDNLFFKHSFELVLDAYFRLSEKNTETSNFDNTMSCIEKYAERFGISFTILDKKTGKKILEV